MVAEIKKNFTHELHDYLAIAVGLALYALSWTVFMLPYGITTGGVTGVAAIIFYATGFEMQISYLLINSLFLVFALKILGWRFCAKTVYAVFLLTIFLKVGQILMADETGASNRYLEKTRISWPALSEPFCAVLEWVSALRQTEALEVPIS